MKAKKYVVFWILGLANRLPRKLAVRLRSLARSRPRPRRARRSSPRTLWLWLSSGTGPDPSSHPLPLFLLQIPMKSSLSTRGSRQDDCLSSFLSEENKFLFSYFWSPKIIWQQFLQVSSPEISFSISKHSSFQVIYGLQVTGFSCKKWVNQIYFLAFVMIDVRDVFLFVLFCCLRG